MNEKIEELPKLNPVYQLSKTSAAVLSWIDVDLLTYQDALMYDDYNRRILYALEVKNER